jgi:hypothetical protein
MIDTASTTDLMLKTAKTTSRLKIHCSALIGVYTIGISTLKANCL